MCDSNRMQFINGGVNKKLFELGVCVNAIGDLNTLN